MFAQDPNDLGSVRKAALAVLGKNQNTVGRNIEDAATTLDKFRLHSEFLKNIGRQTGGARQIISTRAIFDRDMHQSSPVLKRYPSLHIVLNSVRRHSRTRAQQVNAICLEQFFQLRGGLLRGLDELRFVVVDRVLRLEL